jgi:hypothetical protein
MGDWFVNGLSWWSTVSPTRRSPTFRFGVHSGRKSDNTALPKSCQMRTHAPQQRDIIRSPRRRASGFPAGARKRACGVDTTRHQYRHQIASVYRLPDFDLIESSRADARKRELGMKKIMPVGLGAALMTIGLANAADLGRPVYKAPPPATAPAPVFSWTGCYIGAHIGGGWGRKDISIPNLATAAEIPPSEVTFSVPPIRDNTSGFLGGGQVGCNYQFASNWVIGIEGDGSAADIRGDVNPPPVTFVNPPGGPFPPGPVPITSSFHAQTDWLASAT